MALAIHIAGHPIHTRNLLAAVRWGWACCGWGPTSCPTSGGVGDPLGSPQRTPQTWTYGEKAHPSLTAGYRPSSDFAQNQTVRRPEPLQVAQAMDFNIKDIRPQCYQQFLLSGL